MNGQMSVNRNGSVISLWVNGLSLTLAEITVCMKFTPEKMTANFADYISKYSFCK